MTSFKYKGRKIELNYSEENLDLRHKNEARGFSKGNLNNYKKIEGNAMFKLIKDAESKKPQKVLDRIMGIKQTVSGIYENRKDNLEICLEGIPLYR